MSFDWFSKLIENSSEVFDLIRSNLLSISLSLTIFAWSIIILPEKLFAYLSISYIRSDYRYIFGIIAYLSTISLILWILFRLVSILYSYLRSRFEIPNLTIAECKRINKYIDENTQTCPFFLTDGVVDRLIQKGLLYKANSNPNSAGEQDFHMYRWVYNRLQIEPNVVKDKLPKEKELEK